MSDIDLVNSFLQRTDLSRLEQLMKEQILSLDGQMKQNTQEREKLTASLNEASSEFLKVSGAFDTLLKLVVTLSKSDSQRLNVEAGV